MIGSYNDNPTLGTRIYKGMFNDGSTQEYAVNRIVLSMYYNVDKNGHMTRLLDFIQRKNDSTVESSDGYTKDKCGRKSRKITTKGWDFLVK